MKTVKLLLALSIILFTTSTSFGQEKPFRIGVKVGWPNLAGIGVEYATPILNEKLAFFADVSFLPETELSVVEEVERMTLDMLFFEVGANYYLFQEGRGLYIGASFSSFETNVNLEGVQSDDFQFVSDGSANVNYGFSGLNLKVGAKLGRGFYFRPEFGYMLNARQNIVTYRVDYPNSPSETQSYEFPDIFSNLNFNIGFGFAF